VLLIDLQLAAGALLYHSCGQLVWATGAMKCP